MKPRRLQRPTILSIVTTGGQPTGRYFRRFARRFRIAARVLGYVGPDDRHGSASDRPSRRLARVAHHAGVPSRRPEESAPAVRRVASGERPVWHSCTQSARRVGKFLQLHGFPGSSASAREREANTGADGDHHRLRYRTRAAGSATTSSTRRFGAALAISGRVSGGDLVPRRGRSPCFGAPALGARGCTARPKAKPSAGERRVEHDQR